jgi:hypothetical protein
MHKTINIIKRSAFRRKHDISASIYLPLSVLIASRSDTLIFLSNGYRKRAIRRLNSFGPNWVSRLGPNQNKALISASESSLDRMQLILDWISARLSLYYSPLCSLYTSMLILNGMGVEWGTQHMAARSQWGSSRAIRPGQNTRRRGWGRTESNGHWNYPVCMHTWKKDGALLKSWLRGLSWDCFCH